MAINVEPLADFVLIKRIEENQDIKHGLHIPQIGQQKSNKGRVIGVGEGRIVGDKIIPIPLREGDIVLFSKYGVEEIELDGEEFLLCRYDECKLKEKLVALVNTLQ